MKFLQKTSTKHTEMERFENILGSPGKFSKDTRGSIIKNEWIKAIDFCVYRLIEIITSSLLTHSTNFRRSFLRLLSIDGLDPFSPANFSLSVFHLLFPRKLSGLQSAHFHSSSSFFPLHDAGVAFPPSAGSIYMYILGIGIDQPPLYHGKTCTLRFIVEPHYGDTSARGFAGINCHSNGPGSWMTVTVDDAEKLQGTVSSICSIDLPRLTKYVD